MALPLRKKLVFAAVANALLFAVLFVVGEVVLRVRAGLRGPTRWLVADAELGYTLSPERRSVNSLGIRHPEIAADKERPRVLVLGDSVSWDPEGFVTILARHLDRVEVINASVPGYTTFQERTLLESRLLAIEPDLVVLQYCLNDNHRFLHELDSGGRWLMTREARDALLPGDGWVHDLLSASLLVTEVRLRLLALSRSDDEFPWQRQAEFRTAWDDASWDGTREHVLAMQQTLRRSGARFAVVAVPYAPQLRPNLLALDRAYTTKPQRLLGAICADAGIPFLDLHPVLVAARDDGRLFRDGVHLTPRGHELVAEELLRFLREEKLLLD